MKKTVLILLLMALLVFSGCDLTTQALGSSNIAEYIQPPPARQPKITGTWEWKESQYLGEGDAPVTEDPATTSRYILISGDFSGAFRQYTTRPSLRSKVVNATNYTILKLRKTPEDLGLSEDELEVITVEGMESFSLEILIAGPDRILVARDGFLHTFERVNPQLDPDVRAAFMKEDKGESAEGFRPGIHTDTTLLLGLRSARTVNVNANVPEYDYMTILLHMPPDEDEIQVYAAQDLYVPRSSGFWTVSVARREEDGKPVERVSAAPFISGETEDTNGVLFMEDFAGRGLTYVNGNYISMETTYYTDTLYSQYETYTFDTLADRSALDITLIAGEKGKEAMLSAGETEMQQLKNENGSRVVRPPDTDEWGIYRRNGRWVYRAIIRAMDGNATLRKAYDLNILTNTKVFSHNELSISWQTIKDRHPSAVDAMTSPNQDYLIIQEPFRLYVYRVSGGVMDDTASKIIRIRQFDRFVMGEWASGNAAKDWLNTFTTAKQLEILE